MRQQKDFTAQIAAVRCLSEPEYYEAGHYAITEFNVEEFSGRVLYVTRKRIPHHAPNIYYSEAFVVGLRGAVKKKYSRLVY
jgi:hypothetical protein